MILVYRNRAFIIIVVLVVLVDLLLLQYPLTNILGFEYSFINSLLICFLTGLNTIIFIHKRKFMFNKSLLNELFRINLILLTLPFIISLIASLFILNCSLLDGIYFYLVIVVPSSIVGFTLAFISLLIWKRFTKTIFVFLFLLIISIPIIEFYFNPQVYFYNPIFGYYPGTIYDETIKIDLKFISYRLINIFYFSSLLVFLLLNRSKIESINNKKKIVVLIFCLLPAVIFYFFSTTLGYSSTTTSIKDELGGQLKTKHFKIYFDKSINKSRIELIGLSSEYFYETIKSELQIKEEILITAFIFKDSPQKKKLMGSANADVSKPWLKQIFVDAESYNSTLKHELVHAFSDEFGATPFKIAGNFSMALTEGIASAIDYCPGNYSVHYLAFLASENGYSVPVSNLFIGLNFFGQVSSLSYIYSGSFCKFLIDTYGVDKFKKYYAGNDFVFIYGKTIQQVEKDYLSFLKQLGFINNLESAKLYFARPPIFKKVCARYFSEQIDEGWALFRQKDYQRAKIKFKNLLGYSGSYSALNGYVRSLNELKEFETALKVLKSEINKYKETSFEYSLKNLLAEQYILNDNPEDAKKIFSELFSENLSYSFHFSSLIKLELYQQPEYLKQYISEDDSIGLSMLNRMNSDSIFYASLPFLINEEKAESTIQRMINEILKDSEIPKSLTQALAILSLSANYFQQQKFETAKLLAIKAIKYKQDKNLNEVLYSQLKKVNWMCNYSDEIKSDFYFNKQIK